MLITLRQHVFAGISGHFSWACFPECHAGRAWLHCSSPLLPHLRLCKGSASSPVSSPFPPLPYLHLILLPSATLVIFQRLFSGSLSVISFRRLLIGLPPTTTRKARGNKLWYPAKRGCPRPSVCSRFAELTWNCVEREAKEFTRV